MIGVLLMASVWVGCCVNAWRVKQGYSLTPKLLTDHRALRDLETELRAEIKKELAGTIVEMYEKDLLDTKKDREKKAHEVVNLMVSQARKCFSTMYPESGYSNAQWDKLNICLSNARSHSRTYIRENF